MLGNVQDIDLKLLRIFRTVVRNGGMAASQVELNVNLPTISKQIKQLEDRLGICLCERGSRGFRLTRHGEQVINATDRLMASLDGFRNEVAEFAKRPVGEVRLGIVDSLATDPGSRIPEAIRNLHDLFPGYVVNFFIGPPNDLECQVLNGSLDLAIGLFPDLHSGLNSITLFHEQHALYCAQTHPLFDSADDDISPEELSEYAYVSWAYQEHYISSVNGLELNVQSSTPFMEGLIYLVLSGKYIGFLPRHAARRWAEAGRLREIMPDRLNRSAEVSLIVRSSLSERKVIAAFSQELMKAHQPLSHGGSVRLPRTPVPARPRVRASNVASL